MRNVTDEPNGEARVRARQHRFRLDTFKIKAESKLRRKKFLINVELWADPGVHNQNLYTHKTII